jgi:hypothetical protein
VLSATRPEGAPEFRRDALGEDLLSGMDRPAAPAPPEQRPSRGDWPELLAASRAKCRLLLLLDLLHHRPPLPRRGFLARRRRGAVGLLGGRAAALAGARFGPCPAPGRVANHSGRHAQLGQHDPLENQPGRKDPQREKDVAPAAHRSPALIAARPCSISCFSALIWRSKESHIPSHIAKTVGSSIR